MGSNTCVRWAGSRSLQRIFCTESSVHRISVIKSRRSLTTEIVKTVLKKFAVFLKNVQLFRHQLGRSKEEGLCCVEALLKPGGSCGVNARGVADNK